MPGDLSKLFKRLGATKAHINFLTRCTKCRIVPDGLLSKPRIHTKKAEMLERRFAKIRMRELLNSLHAKAFVLQMEIDSYPDKEKYKLSSTKLKKVQDREYYERSKRHSKRFAILRAKSKEGKEGRNFKLDAVLNLSNINYITNHYRMPRNVYWQEVSSFDQQFRKFWRRR